MPRMSTDSYDVKIAEVDTQIAALGNLDAIPVVLRDRAKKILANLQDERTDLQEKKFTAENLSGPNKEKYYSALLSRFNKATSGTSFAVEGSEGFGSVNAEMIGCRVHGSIGSKRIAITLDDPSDDVLANVIRNLASHYKPASATNPANASAKAPTATKPKVTIRG